MTGYVSGEPARGRFGEPRVYAIPVVCGVCGGGRRAFSVSLDGRPECVSCVGEPRRRTALLALIAEASAAEGKQIDKGALGLLVN
jgi:hypothetical protein